MKIYFLSPRPVVAGLRLKAVSLVLLALSWALPGRAQTSATQAPEQAPRTAPQTQRVLPSYEGQTISSIELAGQPGLDQKSYESLLVQKVGEPFSQEKVDATLQALKGKFQEVELDIAPQTDGVRLLFVLQPAIYFGIFEFPGAGQFPYSRLIQVAEYPPRGPYTDSDIQHGQIALQNFFRRSGFFQAEVSPEVQVDKEHGIANIAFHTTLKSRAKFGEITIKGPTEAETARLKAMLRTFMARLRGSAIRPGKTYRLKTIQNAANYLENHLIKQDRLAAKVQLVGANYNAETNRADIAFNVEEGPFVRVKVEGAHLWSWTKRRLLPVYQEIGVDPELIQEGTQNLVSNFQSKGYFDAKVETDVQQQSDGETIVYKITKGPRHKVTAVKIAGNQHMSTEELITHVSVNKAKLPLISHGSYSDKLVRTSVNNLKKIYEANGFSSVKIASQVTNNNGNIVVTFQVDEGPQDIVQDLQVQGNETLSEKQLAPKGMKLAPGKPYSQQNANADRNQIVAKYLESGYLTATFRETVQTIAPHRLAVLYQIYEGPQVRTANIVTLGRGKTNPKLIALETASLKSGQPLIESHMLTSESRLYTLGIFDWAQVDPRRQITTQTQEDAIIKVHESKRNALTYGFGFEVINRGGSVPSGTIAVPGLPPVGLPSTFKTSEKTFWGPRGTFEYTRKNLRGKAESLTFSGLAGRLDQRGSITFSDPNFRFTRWNSNVVLSGEHDSENPIFTSRQGQVSWQLQRALDETKTKNLFIRYSYSQTGLTRLLIPALVPVEDQHVRLSTISGSFVRDTRDNALDAHKGIYESFELDLNPSFLGSSVNFAKLLAQTAYYKKIPANIVWANSLRIGLEQPFSGSHVPLSQKFFSGGGSTIRGFPLNGAGPQRTIPACGNPADTSTCSLITVPVGGNQLFIVNSELRIPVPIKKNLGVALFYDGGNVFERIGFHEFGANYTNTVGAGLRYSTPIGPVRIDLGHNLNALPGIKSTQFFITLGQAF